MVLCAATDAVEQLRVIVYELSVLWLCRASTAAMHTLQALRQPKWPLSPLRPWEKEEEEEADAVEWSQV